MKCCNVYILEDWEEKVITDAKQRDKSEHVLDSVAVENCEAVLSSYEQDCSKNEVLPEKCFSTNGSSDEFSNKEAVHNLVEEIIHNNHARDFSSLSTDSVQNENFSEQSSLKETTENLDSGLQIFLLLKLT